MKASQVGQVRIGGVAYQITKRTPFVVDGKSRIGLRLKRPNGKRTYFGVVYEDGSISRSVA